MIPRYSRPDMAAIWTEEAKLARWLEVDIYQSLSPRTLAVREFNSGITLRDGDVWSASH